MGKSVRLSDDLVSKAEVYSKASLRSVPKQIEHWAKIGRMMEDNPGLTYGAMRAKRIRYAAKIPEA